MGGGGDCGVQMGGVNMCVLCWLQDRVIYRNLVTVPEQDLFYLSPDSGTIVLKSSLQATTRSQYIVSHVTTLVISLLAFLPPRCLRRA